MKTSTLKNDHESFESIIAYCCGNPQGDELPQVASAADIALDIYNDMTSMPREATAAYLHHQMDDENVFH